MNTYDFTIEQGATWSESLTYLQDDETTPVDLTGWSARGQIRKHVQGPVLADFTCAIPTPANGEIQLSLSATATKGVTSNGVYDVELVNGETVVRILSGKVAVSPEVTQP